MPQDSKGPRQERKGWVCLSFDQRPRPAQGFVNDGVHIGLGLAPGNLLLVNSS
jgi:hypothetical protein